MQAIGLVLGMSRTCRHSCGRSGGGIAIRKKPCFSGDSQVQCTSEFQTYSHEGVKYGKTKRCNPDSDNRRAVWLNPFEYRFVCHLAWCLYKQGCIKEANEYIKKVDIKHLKVDEESQMIIERIKQNEK